MMIPIPHLLPPPAFCLLALIACSVGFVYYALRACAEAQHHKLRNDEYERVMWRMTPFHRSTRTRRNSFGDNFEEKTLLLPLTALSAGSGLGVFAQ